MNSLCGFSKHHLSICIPVHDFSNKLISCLEAIQKSHHFNFVIDFILIVNSGPTFSVHDLKLDFGNVSISILDVPNNFYWSSAVAFGYKHFLTTNSSSLLLMNHDCYVTPKAISTLVNRYIELGPNSVCHSLVLDSKLRTIWWAGAWQSPFRRKWFPFVGQLTDSITVSPIQTTSTMGQCLLMPRSAVNCSWLFPHLLPHYFADSVQTSCMRRAGYSLYVIPESIVLSDQSDHDFKKNWLSIQSIADLWKVLFHPKSSRNLLAVGVSSFLHRDTILERLIWPAFEVFGKFVMSVFELILFWINKALIVLPR